MPIGEQRLRLDGAGKVRVMAVSSRAHGESQSIPRTDDAVDTPADVSASGWKKSWNRTRVRLKEDRITVAAGSLAYHWFLAVFPAIIAALGVLTLLNVGPGTIKHLTHGISHALPSGTAAVFSAAVRAATRKSAGSTAAIILGVAIALWSASSGMAILQQTLDVAYEVPTDRTFLGRRLRAFPLMALVAVVGGCAGALLVFGQPIGGAIKGVSPVGGTAFIVVWTAVRWVLALGLLSFLFSGIYFLAPNRESPRWQWVSPGGLLATSVFLLASLGFSYYVSSFGSYSKTYGSFAGAAILIFWFWLVGLAVLVGGELNAEIEREAGSDDRIGEAPAIDDGRRSSRHQLAG